MTHHAFLKSYTLADVLKAKSSTDLIYAQYSTPINRVVNLLSTHNIVAVPILKNGAFVGILDILDVVTFVAFFVVKDSEGGKPVLRSPEEEIMKKPVGDILDISIEPWNNHFVSKFFILESTETVDKALEPFSKGVRRILVRHEGSFQLMSQTDIMKFAQKYATDLGEIMTNSLESLRLADSAGRPNLEFISGSESALEGFRKIALKKVNAIAVVDEQGKLVANLSAADLRGMKEESMKDILLPTVEFLGKVRGMKPLVPVTCCTTGSLKEVVDSAMTAKVHRVWVVDAAMKPLGVVSFSDICRKLSPFDINA